MAVSHQTLSYKFRATHSSQTLSHFISQNSLMADQDKQVGGTTAYGYPAPTGQFQYQQMQPPQPQAHQYAHPYPAYHGPPPAQPYPPNPNPYAYPAAGTATPANNFFRRLLGILLIIVVLFGIAILIFWLVVRPHKPRFYLDTATLNNLDVSDTNRVNLSLSLGMSVHNTNKKVGIYYEDVNSVAVFRGEALAFRRLPWFSQRKENTTSLNYTLTAVSQYLSTSLYKDLKDAEGNGKLGLVARINAWVRFRIGSWMSRYYSMSVFCDVPLVFDNKSSVARLSASSTRKRCNVLF